MDDMNTGFYAFLSGYSLTAKRLHSTYPGLGSVNGSHMVSITAISIVEWAFYSHEAIIDDPNGKLDFTTVSNRSAVRGDSRLTSSTVGASR